MEEEMGGNVMSGKRGGVARNALAGEVEGGGNVRGTHDARKALRGRRGAAFAPIASIRSSKGEICEGEALNEEFARQMEMKQGRAADIFPAMGEGDTELDFTLEELVEAVRLRQRRAPGKSGFPAAALKEMTLLSLAVLGDVIKKAGSMRYVEPILT